MDKAQFYVMPPFVQASPTTFSENHLTLTSEVQV